MHIPFSPPDISELEIAAVAAALRSGWITTGPRVKELERQIAAYCHTEKAVCLNSATACMELILHVLGVGPGDEVITSSYTYSASASVICHVGATPVLVDTAPGSYEMDIDRLAAAITPRTKVIIPVDVAGIMCDYRKIVEMTETKRKLFSASTPLQEAFGRIIVLSDAAHAFGASQQGLMSGEIADFTSFSFHAVKNFTTAEGGALTWKSIPGVDNQWLYTQFMLLSLHGQSKDAFAKTQLGAWEYDILSTAYKCNMTDVAAALGLVQMQRYEKLLERRKTLINYYDQRLKHYPLQLLRHYSSQHSSSGHLYMVRCLDKDIDERNALIVKMAERGIACNVHYKPLPMMTAYKNRGFDMVCYPNAYNMYRNEITLPLYSKMTDEEAAYVMDNFIALLE